VNAGGRHHPTTNAWLVRVSNLRHGDRIHCLNWSDGEYWYGGEVLVVQGSSHSTGDRDGFHLLWVSSEKWPEEVRELCVRPDDEVTVAGRPMADPDTIATVTDRRTKRLPRRGQQLKLF